MAWLQQSTLQTVVLSSTWATKATVMQYKCQTLSSTDYHPTELYLCVTHVVAYENVQHMTYLFILATPFSGAHEQVFEMVTVSI